MLRPETAPGPASPLVLPEKRGLQVIRPAAGLEVEGLEVEDLEAAAPGAADPEAVPRDGPNGSLISVPFSARSVAAARLAALQR
ncbi:MAG: hypothetical protein ABEK84_09325 [Salinibacter sp.]